MMASHIPMSHLPLTFCKDCIYEYQMDPFWLECPPKDVLDGMAILMVLTGIVTFGSLTWGGQSAAYGRYYTISRFIRHRHS